MRRAILSIGRKNGKTALIAALVLVHLVGPECVVNGEIYSAANDRAQAGQIYKVAAQIIEADADLSEIVKPIPSTKTLVHRASGSFYRAISREAGTKHGLNPSFVIYDELAQAKGRDLYDVLDTSMGARSEPLFCVISTQSNDPEHILSKLIDDGLSGVDPTTVCHLYAVPDDTPDEDIWKERTWRLANPALGDFRSLDDLRSFAIKAKSQPANEAVFRNLYLNQRISPNSALITRAEWFACVGNATIEPGEEVYLGLDLSSVNDLTALVMVSAHDVSRVQPFFWKPFDLLEEQSVRDFGGGHRRYVEWHDAGLLFASPGKSIDKEVVARFIAELSKKYRILAMAYDRWRIEDLIKGFDQIGFAAYKDKDGGDGLRLIEWGQGFRDMSPAIDALEQAVLDRKLVHDSHPILNWNIANAVPAKPDPAGNRKLDKEKSRFRIDGAIALTMALGLKARERTVANDMVIPRDSVFVI